jgi:NAD(P)-dependent dehydrogenase (short-subunit alcohol dehydrogenase family)
MLASEGCDLVLTSRSLADLRTAQARLHTVHDIAVEMHAQDVSEGRGVDALAAAFPDIDILVNNAGTVPGGTLDAVEEARWRAAWDLKVFGDINVSRRFYVELRRQVGQRGVDDAPDHPQRMVRPDPRLQVHVAEQRPSHRVTSPHPRLMSRHMQGIMQANPPLRISAAC